jgi:hypothetical protein
MSGKRDAKDGKAGRRGALLVLPGGAGDVVEPQDRDGDGDVAEAPGGIPGVASCNPLKPGSNLLMGWYSQPETSKPEASANESGAHPGRSESEEMFSAGVAVDLAPGPPSPEAFASSLGPRRAMRAVARPSMPDSSGLRAIAATIWPGVSLRRGRNALRASHLALDGILRLVRLPPTCVGPSRSLSAWRGGRTCRDGSDPIRTAATGCRARRSTRRRLAVAQERATCRPAFTSPADGSKATPRRNSRSLKFSVPASGERASRRR